MGEINSDLIMVGGTTRSSQEREKLLTKESKGSTALLLAKHCSLLSSCQLLNPKDNPLNPFSQ